MKKTLLIAVLVTFALHASAQWIPQATGFTAPSRGLQYVHAVDANVVWAAAYDGVTPTNWIQEFTRTVNGGNLWTPGTIPAAGCGFSMIFALDGQTAWAAMFSPNGTHASQGIYKTTNGGVNWVEQTTAVFNHALGAFPNVVHFFNANEGFCMGDPVGGFFEIYITNNGGTNWTRVPTTNIPAPLAGEWGIVGYYDAIGNTVWFGTNKGRVFRSVDKGNTWTVATTPLTNKYVKPKFANELYGIIQDVSAGTTGALAKTEDGGLTWELVSHTGPLFWNDISYVPGTDLTFVSTGAATGFSGASYSHDGGETWTEIDGSLGTQFLATDWVNATTGWAGGFSISPTEGGIFKFAGNLAANPIITVNPPLLYINIVQGATTSENLQIGNAGAGVLEFDIEVDYLNYAQLLWEEFEDATFPPTGWTKFNPDGGTGWTTVTAGTTPIPGWMGGTVTSIDDGTKMAFCTWNTGGATMNDQWLVSPQITIADNTELSFWMRRFSQFVDKVEIRISTTTQNTPAAFNILVDAINFDAAASQEWEFYYYDLDTFVPPGTPVYIAFREHVADNKVDGAAIFLDNIKVASYPDWMTLSAYSGAVAPGNTTDISINIYSAGLEPGYYMAEIWIYSNDPASPEIYVPVDMLVTGVGINDPGRATIAMYPNPASNLLNIDITGPIRTMQVFNANGQIIADKNIEGNSKVTLDVSNYRNGAYTIRFITEEGDSFSRRVMINR